MSSTKDPDQVFAERLRAIRELRKFSQVELGQRADMPASSVAHFEAGSRKPSFNSLRRLAEALDVSTDYLLGISDEAAGATPTSSALFRDLDRLSGEDLELTRRFMEMLASRNRSKRDAD